jgi:hypothetical protein
MRSFCFPKILPVGAIVLAVFASVLRSHAYLPAADTAGGVTLTIGDPGAVKALGEPVRIEITVKNGGAGKVEGTVRLAVIDDWRVEDGDGVAKGFSVEASGTQALFFRAF